MIVFHHTYLGIIINEKLGGEYIYWGQGVSFFFVLSGFILWHVYPNNFDFLAAKKFLVSRVARIWPLHVFLLLGGSCLGIYQHTHDNGSWQVFMANLCLMQAWVPLVSYYFSYNSLSWSISTEVGFYLSFILIRLFRQNIYAYLVFSLFLLVIVFSFCNALSLTPEGSSIWSEKGISVHGLVYISPLGRLFEFVLGAFVAEMHKCHPLSFGKMNFTILEGFTCLMVIANMVLIHFLFQKLPQMPSYFLEYLRHSGGCLSIAVLIYIFAHQGGGLSRLLQMPILVFLGESSFALYLIHHLIWSYLHPLLQPHFIGLLPMWLIYWPIILGSASLVHLFIEHPMRRLVLRSFNPISISSRHGN